MPYTETDHPDCGDCQIAVLKDDDGQMMGCHESMADAQKQMDALMAEDDDMGEMGSRWVAEPLAIEGRRTGDGRTFASLSWRDLPLTLRWVPQDVGGHEGAVRVGRIDGIVHGDDGELLA